MKRKTKKRIVVYLQSHEYAIAQACSMEAQFDLLLRNSKDGWRLKAVQPSLESKTILFYFERPFHIPNRDEKLFHEQIFSLAEQAMEPPPKILATRRQKRRVKA